MRPIPTTAVAIVAALLLPSAACNCAAGKRAEMAAMVRSHMASAAGAHKLRGKAAVGTGITPVSGFNTSQYAGLWYQVYDDAAVQSTFEYSKVCVTASCMYLHLANLAGCPVSW